MIGDPLSIGTPATHTLSLTPTVLPASGPSAAPRIEHFQLHPFDGLSSPTGRCPSSSRGYETGRLSSWSSSRRSKPVSVGPASSAKTSSSSSLRPSRYSSAIRASSARDGGWMGTLSSSLGAVGAGRRARPLNASSEGPERQAAEATSRELAAAPPHGRSRQRPTAAGAPAG